MHRENWDDLRFVLAVARQGSVSAAARALSVNHATVLRRIAAFEERHGGAIFDKTPRGYLIPMDKAEVIEAARAVEAAVLSVDRLIESAQAPLYGTVRLTSTDTFFQTALIPVLKQLRTEAPELDIEIISTNAHLDFARLDADITVRPTLVLPDEMRGDKVGELGFATFAAEGANDGWLGLSSHLSRAGPGIWMAENVAPEDIVSSADSFIILRDMASAGMGRATLPAILGDVHPKLHRIDAGPRDMSVPIWVASHMDVFDVPRIRAAREILVRELRKFAAPLRGGVQNTG